MKKTTIRFVLTSTIILSAAGFVYGQDSEKPKPEQRSSAVRIVGKTAKFAGKSIVVIGKTAVSAAPTVLRIAGKSATIGGKTALLTGKGIGFLTSKSAPVVRKLIVTYLKAKLPL